MIKRSRSILQYKKELEIKSDCYKPGIFWQNALKEIEKLYLSNGLSNFRNHPTNLSFFVPTYGYPGNGLSVGVKNKLITLIKNSKSGKDQKFLWSQINGNLHALADYRVFAVKNKQNDPFGLRTFSESKVGKPIEHFLFDGRWFSRSSLNYLLGLSFLNSVDCNFKPRTILEIGGGYGSLAEVIGKSGLNKFKYIGLDLPPMFLLAREYIEKSFRGRGEIKITQRLKNEKLQINDLERFSFLPNWTIEKLHGSIDLFVNFISFQEMEPEIVKNYAYHIQRLKPKYLLLRNMKEGKQVASDSRIGVKKPIKRKDYFKFFANYELIESSVLEYGFQTVDKFNSELMVLKKLK